MQAIITLQKNANIQLGNEAGLLADIDALFLYLKRFLILAGSLKNVAQRGASPALA